MLVYQLSLMLQHAAHDTSSPRLFDLAATSTPGSVPLGTPAAVIFGWQVEGLTDQVIAIYKDNVLQTTLPSSEITFTYTVAGFAESTHHTPDSVPVEWRFRVELRSAAGALLSSSELVWRKLYEPVEVVT